MWNVHFWSRYEGDRDEIILTRIQTATCPFLSPLVHALSHQSNLEITILTAPTTTQILPAPHAHNHEHGHENDHNHEDEHHSQIKHVQTSFATTELPELLKDAEVLILLLIGSDIHFSFEFIKAASLPTSTVKLIIPSEFGLCTSNPKVREILPPYETRHLIQDELRKSGVKWKAVYSGIVLEDAMTTDGVLGLDCLWCSVVVFPHEDGLKIPVSTYNDVATQIVSAATSEPESEGNEIYTFGFRASLDELVKLVEKKIDRTFDRYEGLLDGARKEAAERFKLGYTDGGMALISRVAVWDEEVGSWSGWKGKEEGNRVGWEEDVGNAAMKVRTGEIGEGGGCGC